MSTRSIEALMNKPWTLKCTCGGSIQISAEGILKNETGITCQNCGKAAPKDDLKRAASGYLEMYQGICAVEMPPKSEWKILFPWEM